MKTKKFISFVLVLVLTLAVLPVSAQSDGLIVIADDDVITLTISNVVKKTTVKIREVFDQTAVYEGTIYWVTAGSELLFTSKNSSIMQHMTEDGVFVPIVLYYLQDDGIYKHSTVGDVPWDVLNDNMLRKQLDSNRTTYNPEKFMIAYMMGDFFATGDSLYDSMIYIAFTDEAVPDALDLSSASDWAVPEITSAIKKGLVPENLQGNYKSNVTRGEVAQMFINLIEQASGKSIDDFMEEKGVSINRDTFIDTNDKAVLAANALGIIFGVGNDKFDPNGYLKRAQIAAIINRVARALGIDTDGYTHTFTDVIGHWSNAELGWPVHAGIIKGVSDVSFAPESELTTEQAIAITYRALAPLSQ